MLLMVLFSADIMTWLLPVLSLTCRMSLLYSLALAHCNIDTRINQPQSPYGHGDDLIICFVLFSFFLHLRNIFHSEILICITLVGGACGQLSLCSSL